MDNLEIILLVLSIILVIASFLFFYPKIKFKRKDKKDKKTSKADKGSDQGSAVKPEKPSKSQKVKRPVLLAAKRPTIETAETVKPSPENTNNNTRQQARPNFENERKIDLTSVRDQVKASGGLGSTGGERNTVYNPVNQSITDLARNRSRTDREGRKLMEMSDTFQGISMDDVKYDEGEVKLERTFSVDEDYMRERRLREDDVFNELKNLSPEMKKILLADIMNRKK